jgi:hypothetical protein
MDSEVKRSMLKNSHLQYNTKAPNNYFEDAAGVGEFFDTNIIQETSECSTTLEKIESESADASNSEYDSDAAGEALQVVDDVTQIIASEDTAQAQGDDMLILNDRMVKTGAKNIAVAGSGTAGVLMLGRKATGFGSRDDDDDDELADDFEEDEKVSIWSTTVVAESEADNGSLLPLQDKKYVKARTQPKSPREEEILAAKYAAIPTVEERAYQILVDLGMIEVSR